MVKNEGRTEIPYWCRVSFVFNLIPIWVMCACIAQGSCVYTNLDIGKRPHETAQLRFTKWVTQRILSCPGGLAFYNRRFCRNLNRTTTVSNTRKDTIADISKREWRIGYSCWRSRNLFNTRNRARYTIAVVPSWRNGNFRWFKSLNGVLYECCRNNRDVADSLYSFILYRTAVECCLRGISRIRHFGSMLVSPIARTLNERSQLLLPQLEYQWFIFPSLPNRLLKFHLKVTIFPVPWINRSGNHTSESPADGWVTLCHCYLFVQSTTVYLCRF